MKNENTGSAIKSAVLTFLFTAVLIATLSIGMTKAYAGVVVLDPGHGGAGTSGAGAIYPPYVEKSLNLDVATKIRDELAAAGVSVQMTRTDDRSLSLPERASIAKSYGANLLISIHFNSSGPHDKHGTEVWASLFGNHNLVGRELGNQVLAQMGTLGFDSKGVKVKLGSSGDYYGIIRYGVSLGIPTVIIEECFLDYPANRAVLETAGTSGIAHATARGILNFLSSSTGQSLMNGTLSCPPVNAANAAVIAAGGAAPQTSSKAAAFTPEEWNWLLSLWAYTGNAAGVIETVPDNDLRALLEEHAKGNM